MVRIPGWVTDRPVPTHLYSFSDDVLGGYTVKVNGQEVDGMQENGYLAIQRKWKKGDVITLKLDMAVRTVKASNRVAADRGREAVVRGPLVY